MSHKISPFVNKNIFYYLDTKKSDFVTRILKINQKICQQHITLNILSIIL